MARPCYPRRSNGTFRIFTVRAELPTEVMILKKSRLPDSAPPTAERPRIWIVPMRDPKTELGIGRSDKIRSRVIWSVACDILALGGEDPSPLHVGNASLTSESLGKF